MAKPRTPKKKTAPGYAATVGQLETKGVIGAPAVRSDRERAVKAYTARARNQSNDTPIEKRAIWEDGDTAEASCEVACTACGKCVADAPLKLMQLARNLAVVNYDWNDQATREPIERFSILWWALHDLTEETYPTVLVPDKEDDEEEIELGPNPPPCVTAKMNGEPCEDCE